MRQTKTRVISWLLVLTMVFSLISPGALQRVSAEESKPFDGYVYVTVEKTTLGQGVILEPVKVGFTKDETLLDIVVHAIGEENVAYTSFTGNGVTTKYLSKIKDGGSPEGWTVNNIPSKIANAIEGDSNLQLESKRKEDSAWLKEYDYTSAGGWMFGINNKGLSTGAGNYTYDAEGTSAETYKDGDVVRLQYTLYGYGSDLNTAEQSNWQTPLLDFPNKDELIKCLADWQQDKTENTYQNALTVLEDWDATQDEVDSAVKDLCANRLSDSYQNKKKTAIQYSFDSVKDPGYQSEWTVFAVARSGTENAVWYHTYKNAIDATVKQKQSNIIGTQATDNARVIIGLTAAGIDVTDVAGYNLLEPLADYTYAVKQGLNGAVYTLIAFDCGDYDIPNVEEGTEQTTEAKLVDLILSKKIENGGWAYFGSTPDVDMTSMVIQALAPYKDTNPEVETAIEEALNVLSDMQQSDGGYKSWGTASSESCSQVLCALSSVGIDTETDDRFVKEGNSVLDALLSFYDETTGGFKHVADGNVNGMATCQGTYALVAYDRMQKKQTGLYDMSDVEKGTFFKCAGAKEVIKNKKAATCTEDGYTGDKCCDVCGLLLEKGETIEKKGHTVVVDPAVEPTEDKEGKTEGSHCSVCNAVIKKQNVLPKIEKKPDGATQTTTQSTTEITSASTTEITDTQTPVALKKPTVSKLKSMKKNQIKLTLKPQNEISGYQIQVSTSSKFKKAKTYNGKKSILNKTIKGLQSGKKYYVRIRTYKKLKENDKTKTIYSKWSKIKKVKVK